MIKEYIDKKTNKKMYEIVGEYIGKNLLTGKEKRIKKKGFKSKKEANLYIARKKMEFESDCSILPENTTFESLFNIWFDSKKHTLSSSTIYGIKRDRKNYLFPKLASLPVKKINKLYIQNIFNNFLSDELNLSTATMKVLKVQLQSIFEYAVDAELIHKNPVKKIIVPKKDAKVKKVFTKDELKFLLEKGKTELQRVYYIYARLLAFTGARPGEIAALQITDFDSKKLEVTINKTISRNENGNYYIKNKPKISIASEPLK